MSDVRVFLFFLRFLVIAGLGGENGGLCRTRVWTKSVSCESRLNDSRVSSELSENEREDESIEKGDELQAFKRLENPTFRICALRVRRSLVLCGLLFASRSLSVEHKNLSSFLRMLISRSFPGAAWKQQTNRTRSFYCYRPDLWSCFFEPLTGWFFSLWDDTSDRRGCFPKKTNGEDGGTGEGIYFLKRGIHILKEGVYILKTSVPNCWVYFYLEKICLSHFQKVNVSIQPLSDWTFLVDNITGLESCHSIMLLGLWPLAIFVELFHCKNMTWRS